MTHKKTFKILNHCIACTLCQKVAPRIFSINATGTLATIIHQPNSEDQYIKGHQALKSCPVSAIGYCKT